MQVQMGINFGVYFSPNPPDQATGLFYKVFFSVLCHSCLYCKFHHSCQSTSCRNSLDVTHTQEGVGLSLKSNNA